MLFSIPGQTMGVSVFTDHLIAALGLSRVRLSTAYMAGTLGSALLMTKAGRLTDRFGVRAVSIAAAAGLALVLSGLSQVDSAARGLSALLGKGSGMHPAAAFAAVTLGFLGIRFFGQGVLTLASRTMVMRWFDARRGRVAAWFGVAVSAGFSYAPRLLQFLINGYGWRGSWLIIAFAILLAALPTALLFFRDSPERCGLLMEGGLRPPKMRRKRIEHHGREANLAAARRDPRYWVYAVFLAWWAMIGTAFTFHVVDIFAARGVGAGAAVAIFLPITFVSVLTNFLGGWAADAVDLPPLYFIGVMGMAVVGGAMLFPMFAWSRIVLIGGYGLAGGLWSVLNTLAWPRLFGREHLGEISGSTMSFMVAGSAVGPWVFSILRSGDGGYFAAGLLTIIGSAALILFGAAAFRAHRKTDSAAPRHASA